MNIDRFTQSFRRQSAALILTAMASIVWAAPALAHPNVQIDCQVSFVFEGDLVVRIEQSWTLDQTFSQQLLSSYDGNHDGRFSPEESQAVADGTLPNLRAFRYFTYVWVDGEDLGTLAPTAFVASVRNGIVTLSFGFNLPSRVDPRRQRLKMEVYDREYYAEVDLVDNDPVLLRGPRSIDCRPQIRDDLKNAYFGYIYPPAITLSCR
jgi:ABC-type uncharacterized transport system substrate-binding protein